jgi:hypothetical protein
VSGEQGEPGVGSVGEEAVKLLGALSGWAQDAAHGVEDHLATGARECTYCPICRTVHAVRSLDPEVRSQLTTAATSLLNAAAGLLAASSRERGARQGVEHIDLDDDGDWPEDTDSEEER